MPTKKDLRQGTRVQAVSKSSSILCGTILSVDYEGEGRQRRKKFSVRWDDGNINHNLPSNSLLPVDAGQLQSDIASSVDRSGVRWTDR